ncbi:hypothetical protein PR048_014405 [Dryococelus australis]|uniref:Reverse transcriptase domain-containing protein n=1 Tax=Dryococelus australis TaxID=614101 RepID=A0ABQ9HEB5_9NEOP|nr:hypothetical protein PR048_014405 [Dryococelus australis]
MQFGPDIKLGAGEMKTAPITVLHSTTKPYHILYDALTTRGITFTQKYSLTLIKEGKYEYFLTQSTTERPTKIVVKNIVAGTDPERISRQGIPAIVVHQMYKYCEPLELYQLNVSKQKQSQQCLACQYEQQTTSIQKAPYSAATAIGSATIPILCSRNKSVLPTNKEDNPVNSAETTSTSHSQTATTNTTPTASSLKTTRTCRMANRNPERQTTGNSIAECTISNSPQSRYGPTHSMKTDMPNSQLMTTTTSIHSQPGDIQARNTRRTKPNNPNTAKNTQIKTKMASKSTSQQLYYCHIHLSLTTIWQQNHSKTETCCLTHCKKNEKTTYETVLQFTRNLCNLLTVWVDPNIPQTHKIQQAAHLARGIFSIVQNGMHSDHLQVIASIEEAETDTHPQKPTPNYSKANWQRFNAVLHNSLDLPQEIKTTDELEESIIHLTKAIHTNVKNAIPHRVKKIQLKDSLPEDVKILITQHNHSEPPQEEPQYATDKEIHLHSHKLSANKAPGDDGIQPIVLKNIQSPALSAITTSVKVAEKVLHTRLQHHIDSSHVLPDYQFGFRAKHSTTHQLTRITEHITNTLIQNQYTAAVFLDIEKAFDRVCHEGLLHKLHSIQIPDYLYIIAAYLHSRKFFAHLPRHSGPTLFNIYVHDFPTARRAKIGCYVDDTMLFASSTRAYLAVRKVQEAINLFQQWFTDWRTAVNVNKSEAIIFPNARSQLH